MLSILTKNKNKKKKKKFKINNKKDTLKNVKK